jgi:tRNA (guanine37-N1)-methyltransferase
MFTQHLAQLPISRAIAKGLVRIDFIDLHHYAIDKRGTVDSPPYGGGPGMILRPEPIYAAVSYALTQAPQALTLFLTPRGTTYTQGTAQHLAGSHSFILVCGRYEGVDQRVIDFLHAQEVSIGNYVLSGGEVAAMAIIESVTRLIPGAIENQEALVTESFTNGKLEHPQYTRPEEWQGLKVPAELLSGHHGNIAKWKQANAK